MPINVGDAVKTIDNASICKQSRHHMGIVVDISFGWIHVKAYGCDGCYDDCESGESYCEGYTEYDLKRIAQVEPASLLLPLTYNKPSSTQNKDKNDHINSLKKWFEDGD